MIPQVAHCRYATIQQIKQKISDDSFTYKSVRVAGRVRSFKPDLHLVVLEDLFSDYNILQVNVSQLKNKIIEDG